MSRKEVFYPIFVRMSIALYQGTRGWGNSARRRVIACNRRYINELSLYLHRKKLRRMCDHEDVPVGDPVEKKLRVCVLPRTHPEARGETNRKH